jgi:hypothetical protein
MRLIMRLFRQYWRSIRDPLSEEENEDRRNFSM